MRFPFPVLVADIGGTNARFAIADAPGAALRCLPHVKTGDFPGAAEAFESVAEGARPRSAVICAAGPVRERGVRLTNAGWTIEGPALASALGLDQGLLLNDFEALAAALPNLKPEWLHPIGAIPRPKGGARLVHGPGTGLGNAALLDLGDRFLPVASEAGHADFGPGPHDAPFWSFVEPIGDRITPESLISGPGLVRLHRARLAARGEPRPITDGVSIVDHALADPTSEAARSVRAFWLLVARYVGDMALTFLTTGGVTLAGGILPRMLPLLDVAAFRGAFENKAPYRHIVEAIPVDVLHHADAVLEGAVALAAAPERFLFDYAARLWR